MNFWDTVRRDFHHHLEGPFYEAPKKTTLVRILRAVIEPEFRIVFAYRVYHWLFKNGHKWLSYLIYIRTKAVTRCDIARESEIGAGFRVSHPYDVVIGPGARLGFPRRLGGVAGGDHGVNGAGPPAPPAGRRQWRTGRW